MDLEHNKKVASDFLDRFNANDVAGVLDAMTDDVAWRIVGKPELLSAAGVHTKEQIARLFHGMLGQLKSELRMTVKGAIAEATRWLSKPSPMASCKTAASTTIAITS